MRKYRYQSECKSVHGTRNNIQDDDDIDDDDDDDDHDDDDDVKRKAEKGRR